MSSFKDTFTRDQGGDSNLQYDDTAFYYFFLTLLVLAIIPLIISILRQIFFNSEASKVNANCPCPSCKAKILSLKKDLSGKWMNKSLFLKVYLHILIYIYRHIYIYLYT